MLSRHSVYYIWNFGISAAYSGNYKAAAQPNFSGTLFLGMVAVMVFGQQCILTPFCVGEGTP